MAFLMGRAWDSKGTCGQFLYHLCSRGITNATHFGVVDGEFHMLDWGLLYLQIPMHSSKSITVAGYSMNSFNSNITTFCLAPSRLPHDNSR